MPYFTSGHPAPAQMRRLGMVHGAIARGKVLGATGAAGSQDPPAAFPPGGVTIGVLHVAYPLKSVIDARMAELPGVAAVFQESSAEAMATRMSEVDVLMVSGSWDGVVARPNFCPLTVACSQSLNYTKPV
eukprot:SAG31_NODE_3613_length_4067_cov_1.304183_1_plen_130_part_00